MDKISADVIKNDFKLHMQDKLLYQNAHQVADTEVIDNQLSSTFFDVHALIESARVCKNNNDYDAAIELANEATQTLRHAKNTPETKPLEAELLLFLAQIHLNRQDFTKLEETIRPLLDLSRQLGDAENEAWALLNLGIVHSIGSDYKSAITLFLESLEKSEKLGYRANVANCLINIGNVYANLFNYEDALDRYQIALNDYADVLNDNIRIATNLNIGNLHHTAEQHDIAIEYFEIGLFSAVKAQKVDMIAHAHTLLSRTYLVAHNLTDGIEHAQKASENMTDRISNATGRQINLLNLAEIAFLKGDTEGGAKIAIQGIAVARRVHDDTSELRGFRLLAKIFEQDQDFHRAYRAQLIYSRRQADFLKMQRSLHALDLEIKYSLSEKQRKIEELTKENSYQALLLEQSGQISVQNDQLKQVNEELRQFAFITSHDLKEPLRMIGSFTQIIHNQYAHILGDDSAPYFKFINEGVNRMSSLLDALLQYATIGKNEIGPEPVEIGEIIRMARANLKINIEETDANILSLEMPTVVSVQSLLIQLFQNLIGNAIKFRRPTGRPIILISAEEQPDQWVFSIEDNGIGIATNDIERIFTIFQRLHKRTEYEGTGIGLAICYKIVTQLGGRIWVESELGKGSTFRFTLPK
jgi:signal transduction histidine kinase